MNRRSSVWPVLILLFLGLVFTGEISGASLNAGVPYSFNPDSTEELRIRDGLPNFFSKISTPGKTVRVGYIGGSITKQNGWRRLSFEGLQKAYPEANLIEINAAVAGTGADFAACRSADDLLAYYPDLVFVEYRVNGGGGFEARAIEGLIRQIWQVNPETDICFVYTIGEWMLSELENGRQTGFGRIMEVVANSYGIPSIDLSVEVVKQKKAGDLIFKSDVPVEGKLVFSKDGVHPLSAGHQLYSEIVARSLEIMKDQDLEQPLTMPQKHGLPPPLESKHFEYASLLSVTNATLSAGWETVNISTDDIYTRNQVRSHHMLNGAVKCSTVGEVLTIEWVGLLICFTTIPQGDGMAVEVSIDGSPPGTYNFTQGSDKNLFAQFFYAPEMKAGSHTATLKVTELPAGTSFYCGQFLVIDDPNRQPGGDFDGDGVVNEDDICPNTAPSAMVDSSGCSIDDDGDGVLNADDLCPNTSPNASVDARGCLKEGYVVQLYFRDQLSNKAIKDAAVSLNAAVQTTSVGGQVIFQEQAGGYLLRVRHPYYEYSDSIVFNGPVNKLLLLNKTYSDLYVYAKMDGQTFGSASVSINDTTQLCNSQGFTAFSRLKVDSSYTYSLSKDMEILKEGNFIMSENENLNIQVTSTLAVADLVEKSYRIYPNPVQESISVSAVEDGASYKVLNLSGVPLLSGRLMRKTIDVQSLPKGFYLLKFADDLTLSFVKI